MGVICFTPMQGKVYKIGMQNNIMDPTLGLLKEFRKSLRKKLRDKLHKEVELKFKKFDENYRKSPPPPLNPFNNEYHDKLDALIQADTNSMDDFINWITGITVAAIIFVYPRFSNTVDFLQGDSINLVVDLTFSEISFLLTFLFGILFKFFFNVRYLHKQNVVKILIRKYKGHDLKTAIEENIKANKEIGLETEIKFLKNHIENIDLADPEYQNRMKNDMHARAVLLSLFYRAAVVFFCIALFFHIKVFLGY